MSIAKCRVCGNTVFDEPLLRYAAMPAAAQSLPDKESLQNDHGVDLEVCQCSGCGLVQLGNEPVPYYRDVIRASAFSTAMKTFRLGQFATFVEKYALQNKKIIEIGCGNGEYLAIMQKLTDNAYGLEHSATAVRTCNDSGLNVQQGFVESRDCRLRNAPFDAFFILNFLEHIPDITALLSGIGNNLHDEAIGLVEVPNFDMILRNRLFSEFIGDHLCYFTRKTLTTCLEINGFEVVECQEIWYDYILSAVVRKRKRLDLTDFKNFQEKLENELKMFIAGFPSLKVAIWGAGHQALAVIALTGLADDIAYVVDSAPFKQGKYTPATHLPIVAPDTLRSNPVDAVIVMAASYADEVAETIRRQHGHKIKVAILRDYGLEIM